MFAHARSPLSGPCLYRICSYSRVGSCALLLCALHTSTVPELMPEIIGVNVLSPVVQFFPDRTFIQLPPCNPPPSLNRATRTSATSPSTRPTPTSSSWPTATSSCGSRTRGTTSICTASRATAHSLMMVRIGPRIHTQHFAALLHPEQPLHTPMTGRARRMRNAMSPSAHCGTFPSCENSHAALSGSAPSGATAHPLKMLRP